MKPCRLLTYCLRSLGSQLGLARKYHLPLFLHSRAAHADLVAILREEGFGEEGGKAAGGKGGVVHSFTGTIDEAVELVSCNIMNNMIVILNPASDEHGFSHQVCISSDL